MAVKLRLMRMGAKKKPTYRIVATIPTDTVKNLFTRAGINKKFADSKVKKDK